MDRASKFLQSLSSFTSDEAQQQQPSTPLQKSLSRSSALKAFKTPFSQFAESCLPCSPTEDLPLDDDFPLDAFDKELLAQLPSEQQPQSTQSLTRISFPPKPPRNSTGLVPSAQLFQEDLRTVLVQTHASSSSSTDLMSSPTISALQNRQKHNPSITTHSQERRPLQDKQTKLNSGQPGQQHLSVMKPAKATRMGLGHAPPIIQGIPLVPSTELPDRYRSIFPYPLFNAMQSKCFQIAFGTNENLVLSAPTGSGKTAVLELAICQLIASGKANDFKAVYQAPTKSLCSERMRDWSGKFSSLGLGCAELTGDTEYGQLRSVQKANIIITTPEKWDSVTRKWKDNVRLLKLVKLFLIDEVHILNEPRGATLEAVVSRMKSVGSDVRFVALSATVPNSDDIATWLGNTPDAQDIPARREVFGEEFRPVNLQKDVWGVRGPINDFAFDMVLNDNVKEAIARFSIKKPTMIFCQTRKSVTNTAKMLANLWTSTDHSHRLWPAPHTTIRVIDEDLKKFVHAGVAFHHGGLAIADRRAVEEGFLNGEIHMICSTSTLAVGVNLPCYLVVIKGTVGWGDHGPQEYSDLEVMQMLGRAGRPQFEPSACAVILTRPEKEQHYRRMVSGRQILESFLHLNLIDHLNSEIGLGTIFDVPSAKKWLTGTFLAVRLKRNPDHYQLKEDLHSQENGDILGSICLKNLRLLQDATLVTSEHGLKCTEFGEAMARYHIKFETMRIITKMAPKAKISEILSMLAQASEFRDIKFKSGEKSIYKDMNGDAGVRFPIKIDIAQPAHKISLLIQTELGGTVFPNKGNYVKHKGQYQIDKNMVFLHVNRLIRCVIDCQLQLEDSVSVRHALELARSLAARVWDSSSYQLKQLDQIGDVGVRKLATAGINSIETLQNTEPHRIEQILGRNPPFGQKILTKAIEFPSLRVTVKQVSKERNPGLWVKVNFKAEIGFINENVPAFFRKRVVYVCFLAETSHGRLIDFRRFKAADLNSGHEILLSVKLEKPTASINCHVMCDEIAGSNRYAELRLENFPANYFPATDSVDTVACDTDLPWIKGADAPTDTDEFGDLDDDDFLYAEREQDGIEVIHDIDQLLQQDQSKEQKKTLKRSASHLSNGDDSGDGPLFPPVQLNNGRWTCQHSCKQDGKKCNHKCCVEGVAKPAKAKTGRTKSSKDTTVRSTEANEGGRISKSTPFDKARSMSELKQAQPATKTIGGSALLQPRNTSNIPKSVQRPTKTPAHAYDKGARPSLSFLKDSGIPSKSNLLPATGDIDMDCYVSPQQKVRIPPCEQSPRIEKGERVEEGIFDFDMTEFQDDGNLPAIENNSSREDSGILNPIHFHRPHYGTDQGGFGAPLTHFVTTETQKRTSVRSTPMPYKKPRSIHDKNDPFITGNSSSPYKAVPPFSKPVQEYRVFDKSYTFDTLFAETDDDYVSSSAPVRKPHVGSVDETSLLSQQNATAVQESAMGQSNNDEENRKRLHKEDQKRRWGEFDPALYMEYGEFVDIVD